jgi:DNA-binding response OmpR family regulator
MLVLVVEDDEDYSEIIAQTLRRDSHEVVATASTAAALRFARQKPPELAVLDVVLPDGSGLEVCRQLRFAQPGLPVIFLSSLDRSADIVAGFDAGGDDYMAKPFHPGELLARVRAVARRAGNAPIALNAPPPKVCAMGLELDTANQAAYFNGTSLKCTRLEFDILLQIVKYPGQVLSHAFLSEQVWGYKNVNDATLLKGHVSALRHKIREAGGDENLIRTVHGVGYSFASAA